MPRWQRPTKTHLSGWHGERGTTHRWPSRALTRRLLALGPFYGPILCCIIAVQHWFLLFIQLFRAVDEIEVVEADWDPEEFDKVRRRPHTAPLTHDLLSGLSTSVGNR